MAQSLPNLYNPSHLSTIKYDHQNSFLKSFLSQINSSFDQDSNSIDNIEEIEEVDVVISGGGMKGFFVVGAWSVLKYLIETKQIIVSRWAGTSVGAASAIYMCCGVDPVNWSNTYWKTRRLIRGNGNSIVESFRLLSHELLPDNAHELCSNKVFLSITLLTALGPKNVIISEFYSKDDLIEACVASCSIPFMTSKDIVFNFRGMRVLDGGFTNNTPLFEDSPRRQLVFYTPRVHYPSGLVLNLKDPCIESLIIRGAFVMRQFIIGHYKPDDNPIIEWIAKQQIQPKKFFDWRGKILRGARLFSSSSLFQVSGIPTSEMLPLTASKPIQDETTIKRVSNEVKRTLAHYRMAIIILIFSTLLMATPIKWEDSSTWKKLVRLFLISRKKRRPQQKLSLQQMLSVF